MTQDRWVAAMPFASLLGIEIDASAEGARGTMLVKPEFCTSGSILHGGAIMAFADALGAAAGFEALPEHATMTTTIESKTNFLGAAKVGVRVVGVTTPVHVGRRTSVWQTKIDTEDGKPVALVLQTQMTLGV